MKKTLWLIIAVCFFFLIGSEVRGQVIRPMEIWSIRSEQPYPIFPTDYWPDICSYFECKGSGRLIIQTKLLDSNDMVVEKWTYNFGEIDCGEEVSLWSFSDTFSPHELAVYKVKFIYTFQGVTKEHETKIRFSENEQ